MLSDTDEPDEPNSYCPEEQETIREAVQDAMRSINSMDEEDEDDYYDYDYDPVDNTSRRSATSLKSELQSVRSRRSATNERLQGKFKLRSMIAIVTSFSGMARGHLSLSLKLT